MSCTCSSLIFFLWKIHQRQTDSAWFSCGKLLFHLWGWLSTFECSGVLTHKQTEIQPSIFSFSNRPCRVTALQASRALLPKNAYNCLETLQFQFHDILVTQSSKSACLGWSRFATQTTKWPMLNAANQISETLTTRASCAMVAWAKPTLAPGSQEDVEPATLLNSSIEHSSKIGGYLGPGHLSSWYGMLMLILHAHIQIHTACATILLYTLSIPRLYLWFSRNPMAAFPQFDCSKFASELWCNCQVKGLASNDAFDFWPGSKFPMFVDELILSTVHL